MTHLLRELAVVVSAVAFVALPIACTVRANVGDLDALPLDSGPSDAWEGEGGSPPTLNWNDASEKFESSIDVGCGVKFAQEASFIDVGVVNDPPPNLEGGAVASGTYGLVAMRVYFGRAQGTMQVRETLLVRGSATAGAFERLTEAKNATGTFSAYPLHGEVATWEVASGPGYFHRSECPQEGTDLYCRFNVSADTLTLFDDFEFVERVYRRLH